MQVVYSGGSTPTPSPHLQRKGCYGRANMPRYIPHVHPQIFVQRSREKLTEGDIALRDSIPFMGTCTAVVCLLLNIVLPGSGTLTAGLSVLCCSKVRPKGGSKAHCILMNAGVGLLQFLLTFVFLLGWIWSLMWGVAFLKMAKNYSNIMHQGSTRNNRKFIHITQNKNPHEASQLEIVTTSRSNRTLLKENPKECSVHNNRASNFHMQQCEHRANHHQQNALENGSPGAYSCKDWCAVSSAASSLIIQDNTPNDPASSTGSPHGCASFEADPEITSLQQYAVLQSQLQTQASKTSNALSESDVCGTLQHTGACRGIILQSKATDCLHPVAHRQTVVLHKHRLHSSFPDICQTSKKRPFKVCLTTVLK
ncbi:hypothetical protein BsWGS_14951 [Bradybaena similaris]